MIKKLLHFILYYKKITYQKHHYWTDYNRLHDKIEDTGFSMLDLIEKQNKNIKI